MSKVVYIEKNDIHCTLTTFLYCNFWCLWSLEQQGHKGYINWYPSRMVQSYEDQQKLSEITNSFEWWFKQPHIDYPPPRNKCEIITWETWQDPSPIPFMSQPLSVIKDYYKKHLRFSGFVETMGELLVSKYKIDFSKTIGITWRGTDIYLDGRPRVPIEVYFPFIDEILNEEPDLRIACTSEEETILDPLLARYPNAFKIEEFVSSPFESKHNPERFSDMSGFERGLQPALMVWFFSKCAHYIKNRSSTGAVASWLSSGRIVSIGHPENLGFPANIPFAEIEGKLYPISI